MKTKSINVKKLLSLVLAIAMMATMVLPTGVFAATASTITTDLDEKTVVVGEQVEFTVSTVPNDDLGTYVKGMFEVVADTTDITSLEYYETTPGMEGWYTFPTTSDGNTISGVFGPVGTGFPMMEATSAFRVVFAKAGTYSVKVSAVKADDDSEVCSETVIVDVLGYADYTELEAIVDDARVYDSSKYTPSSFSALTTAITNAENAISENWTSDKQSDITDLVNDIRTAIASLVEVRVVGFTAVAVAADASVNYAKADKIYLVFTEAIANDADILSKLEIEGETASNYVENPYWVDNTIYSMDIKADLNNNAAIKFLGDENIKAVAGYALDAYETTIIGNLEEAYEEVTATKMTATIVKCSEVPGVVDGDKIIIVFNAPVYKNPSSIEVNGMEATAVSDTANTVYQIELDGTETISAGDTFSYNGMNAVLTGSFGTVIVPEVVRALIADEDGTALTKGDKIYVFFSTPTNKVPGADEHNFTGVLECSTGKWVDSQTLEIILGTTEISESDRIDLTSLMIKDVFGIENVNATDIELEGSFGVAIQPALLTLTAISKKGSGVASEGDEIHLAFNVKMREDALDLTDFNFNYGDYGTNTASVRWATGSEYTDYSTIIITLGQNPAVVPGTTKISVNMDLYEMTGTKKCTRNNLANCVVTGTFGTSIAPALINATVVKKVPVVGAQNNDQIILLFNVPTNGYDIANLVSISGKTLGLNYTGEWSNNNTVYTISLGTNPTVDNGDEIVFENDGTLKDINGQKTAASTTIAINGSFGVEADEVGISPSSVVATIVKTTSVAGANAGDKIVFAFNVATNGVDLVNYFTLKGKFGTGLTGGWNAEKTLYTLILGENATITDEDVIEFTTEAGIKDANEVNSPVTLTTGALVGSFGTTIVPEGIVPSLLSATIIKGDGNTGAAAQAGDKVVFAFNMATNTVELLSCLGGTTLFGQGAVGTWNEDGNIYTVTIGSNATITDDAILTITADAGLKDKNEYSVNAVVTNIVLIGSFGVEVTPVAPQPKLLSATIIKGDGNTSGAAQAGDKVVFAFNMATNTVELLDNLGGTTLFGQGAAGAWNEDGNIYTVTIGSNATIADDAVLTITADAGLKDKNEYSANAVVTNIVLIGSFGVEVTPVAPQPELLRVDIIKVSSKMGAQEGDKIRFIFNIKTNKVDDLTSRIQQTLEGTAITAFGNGVRASWNEDGSVYEIILGKNPKMTEDVKLVIPASAGIKDSTGTSVPKEYIVNGFNGTFGESIAPEALSAIAYSKDGVDYIDIVFNVVTDKKVPTQGETLFTNSNLGEYTATWNEAGNVLTIALGDTFTIKKGDSLSFDDRCKISSKDGNSAMANNSSIVIEGELRMPMVTEVIASKDGEYGTIKVVFSSKTNGGKVDLSAQSSSLGIGAVATWNETNTVLTITLGKDKTISVGGGYILLNGLGITNGFDDNEIVGQYSITSGALPQDELKAVDARVNARENGDFLTVTFNAPTNMYGKVLEEEFDMSDIKANIEATYTFGTGATAVWESSTRLVIKLGDDSTFKIGTSLNENSAVTFKELKFANGLGTIVDEAITVTGSFDGREIKIKDFKVVTENEYTTAKASVNKQELNYVEDAIVTFVIWDATKAIITDMNAVKVDMAAVDTIEVTSKFALNKYSKVEVYVTNEYIDAIGEDTTFDILATTVTTDDVQNDNN